MVTSFTDIELTGRRNTTFDNAEGTRSPRAAGKSRCACRSSTGAACSAMR
jgi:hypothetical protein